MYLKLRSINLVVSLIACIHCGVVAAVCLDSNGISGWHPSVNEELNSSIAVIIGQSERSTDLFEDAEDPKGVTATIYRVHVIQLLRGHLPKMITIRAENDSGRFPLETGRKYLLFISQDKKSYYVSNCGSSGLLSESSTVLKQLGVSMENIK